MPGSTGCASAVLTAGVVEGFQMLLDCPCCVTVTVCPATVIVPLRDPAPLLAATEYPTVPLPSPVAPAVMVIQVALLVAVQLHPACAVTLVLPVSPPATAESVVGDTL